MAEIIFQGDADDGDIIDHIEDIHLCSGIGGACFRGSVEKCLDGGTVDGGIRMESGFHSLAVSCGAALYIQLYSLQNFLVIFYSSLTHNDFLLFDPRYGRNAAAGNGISRPGLTSLSGFIRIIAKVEMNTSTHIKVRY